MRSPEFPPHPQSPKEPAVDTDSPSDETTPRKPSRLQRFNKVVMRFVGPANRSSMNLRGNTEMTPEGPTYEGRLLDRADEPVVEGVRAVDDSWPKGS